MKISDFTSTFSDRSRSTVRNAGDRSEITAPLVSKLSVRIRAREFNVFEAFFNSAYNVELSIVSPFGIAVKETLKLCNFKNDTIVAYIERELFRQTRRANREGKEATSELLSRELEADC